MPSRLLLASTMIATALLVGCANMGPVAATAPLPCDDGLKTAFQPDALNSEIQPCETKCGMDLVGKSTTDCARLDQRCRRLADH